MCVCAFGGEDGSFGMLMAENCLILCSCVVFSAVSGLELSMSKEQHQCESL